MFSSLLPFGRADFGPSVIFGGTKQQIFSPGSSGDFLYLMDFVPLTPSGKRAQIVAAAGEAKLRITPKPGNSPLYPYSQQRTGSAGGIYYAGNDWLTLLDACALEDDLAVEIFSLFPVETILDPGERLGTTGSTFREMVDTTKACITPTPSPTPLATWTPPPSAIPLLSVPLKCPKSLIKLGKARRQSKLRALDSPFRMSYAELALKALSLDEQNQLLPYMNNPSLMPTPEQSAILTKFISYFQGFQLSLQNISTDLDARTAVYRSLLIAPDSIKHNIDPLAYYERCAPKSCTWFETSLPTLLGGRGIDSTLYFSLDKVGAGAGAAMIIIYALYLFFIIVGRAILYRSRPGAEYAEPASASGGDCADAARLSSEEVKELRAALAQLKRQLARQEPQPQLTRPEPQPQPPRAGPALPAAQQSAAALMLRADPPRSAAPLAGPAAAAPAAEAGGAGALHPGRVRLELPSAPSARPSATALEVAALVWKGGAGELPPHWDHKLDGRGEVYFITADGQSTWDDPRLDWLTCASPARSAAPLQPCPLEALTLTPTRPYSCPLPPTTDVSFFHQAEQSGVDLRQYFNV